MPTFTRKLSDLIKEDFNFGLTDLDYPIYDETMREDLNQKILKHYWNYEIGQETESMFRFSLNRKMNEIMPYYNQLYRSAQLEIDPLLSMKYSDIVDMTNHATGTSSNNGTTTGTSSSDTTSKARSVQSETPQVLLSPNEDYASNATNNVSDAQVTANNSGTTADTNNRTDDTTGNTTRNIQGYNIPTADLLLKFRATFLNIDMMVIDDLKTLFMQVWDNGDEYFADEGWYFNVAPFGL